MSKVKMIEAIAVHDLSYVDHNNEPQYKRQGSTPFFIDQANFDFFAARGGIKRHKVEAVAETVIEKDEFDDEEEEQGADAAKQADAKPAQQPKANGK